MKSRLLLIALLAITISTGVSAQKTWTGTTSTAWNTSTNWSPAGAPTAADNVTIPSAPSNQPLLSGTTGVCNNLTINAGALLTISGTSSNNALLTASGNTIIYGSLSIGSAITHTGTFTTVNVTWASGSSMAGAINGGINVSGNWEFATGSAVSMGYTTVTFTGSNNSTITSNSANSNFYGLVVNKTGGAIVYIGAASTSALTINGVINIGSGAVLNGQANITTILKGNLVNSGNINMGSGTLSFEKTSGTQSIQININDYFNSININTGGTVTISTSYIMQLMGNMTIQAGVLDAGASIIGLFGNWTNNVGTSGFTEGTGTVIFNGGNVHQYCTNENFYNLEVHKAIGGALRMNGTTVTCSHYNWTAGSVDVLNGGTFTANNLEDGAIAGNFYCNANCTINLYNYGGNIDLRGNLYIYGGNFNVYGGINPSWWPYQGNASITMSGGVLNFVDQGILIRTDATYTFTNNITGGTIKTAGNFTNGRPDFIPTAGTLELAGTVNTNLTMNAGSLFNLAINKATANTVTLATNVTVNGVLTVQSGIFLATGKILFTNDNISVNNGGTLWIENGSILRVKGTKAITVANGGTLKAIGTSVSKPIITDNAASGHHEFHVYGTISARYAIFEYNYGINIYSTATVDPLNPFDQCTFSYGGDRFLYFSNNQELMIRGANFPTSPLSETVWKNNNSGRVNFRDAAGAYAGQAYENDPFNRIDWTTSQPGLWTGAVSTDWHTAGNWDDLVVPDATRNVTIPTGVTNMPVVSAAANCNSLTLNGTLTIGNATLVVAGNAAIAGNVTMTHSSGILTFNNDVAWNSGSTASIASNSSIRAYGNWDFNPGANVQIGFSTVFFLGTVSKAIRSYSAGCSFYTISFSKTGGAITTLSELSTQPLTVNGSLRVESGSVFKSNSTQNLVLNNNMVVYGTLQCDAGAVMLDGPSQNLIPNVNDYFNHLIFSQTGTASFNTMNTSTLNVKGDLHIDSGVFEAGNYTINVGGNWDNNAGTAAFNEGGSRVVFNGGNYHQYIWNDETFNILEVNKPLGGAVRMNNGAVGRTVICGTYDWTAGAIDVLNGGTFTANALADNAIAGSYYCNANCTINLYNYGGNIDLRGNLYIYGGNFNIYGGNNPSWWPYLGNASITMSGGVLNLADQGILIRTDGNYTFTNNITGGTIKTAGLFTNGRTDFAPAAGTIELYGTNNCSLTMTAGSLNNLTINKQGTGTISLGSNVTVGGITIINSGTLKTNNRILNTCNGISINSGGTLWVDAGAELRLTGSTALIVNTGGTLKVLGTPDNNATITQNGATGFHEFHVYGNISARYATFAKNRGINLFTNSVVDSANSFDYCTFQNGMDRYLFCDNSQELMIRGACFPTFGVNQTVYKSNNNGRLNFRDATGAYAGAAYELDPYNRIDWTTSQPGLWTGAVSTDWFTAENWDDLVVPVAATNVTIPDGLNNNPIIGSATAYCNDLNINGQLRVSESLQVGGNVNVSGNLIMNQISGIMTVQGNFNWNSGSTASFVANTIINLYGDWNFFSGSSVHLAMGNVHFQGPDPVNISCYSANSYFHDVSFDKTGGAMVTFNAASTHSLRVTGFYVSLNGGFTSNCPQNIIVQGNLYTDGLLTLNNGAVVLEGMSQSIMPEINSYFNDLIFSQSGTVNINNTNTGILHVKGSVTIESGVFNMQDRILKVERDWNNTAGSYAFNEGTGRVIFTGTNPQLCSTETFNILEIDKASQYFYDQTGSSITCQVYDWTRGGIWIAGGSTFYAADLADDGVYGDYFLWGNSVELHQDAGHSVNLLGNITIHGGEFIIDGGNDFSRWGDYGNASLTMSAGILDIKGIGLTINDAYPYVFTGNITGGTIRTQGSLIAQSPGFNPTGGLVEFYGMGNPMMQASNGSAFYDVNVNMPGNQMGRLSVYSSVVKNNLIIEEGMVESAFGSELKCGNNLEIQDGGWFALSSGTLSMGNLAAVNVNQNGLFSSFGYEGALSVVKGASSEDVYSLSVNSGGHIEAVYTVFEDLPVQGVYIAPGAMVNPYYAFTHCEFRNGESGSGTLLSIENEQDLVIENAFFPANSWGGQNNVRKQLNHGSVTFVNATGAFAGEAFEDDPYGRIHWGAPKQLNLTLFLEGLYNGTDNMRQASNENGPQFGSGIADEIRVEFRNASDYNEIEYFVENVQLGTNGHASIYLPANLSASYYITIRHRNSIETTTPAPVSLAPGIINYSFDNPSKAYGGNLLLMITGQYAIYSGDVNQDGIVDTGDITPVDNDTASYSAGYLVSDVNGDGITDTADMTIVDNNAAGYVGSVTP